MQELRNQIIIASNDTSGPLIKIRSIETPYKIIHVTKVSIRTPKMGDTDARDPQRQKTNTQDGFHKSK